MNLIVHVTRSGAKGYVYPTIRLPTDLQHLIGKEVSLIVEQLPRSLNPSVRRSNRRRPVISPPIEQELSNQLSKRSIKKVVIFDDGVPDGIVERYTVPHGTSADELTYTPDQLEDWVEQWHSSSKSSQGWIRQVAKLLNHICNGTISRATITDFMKSVQEKYAPPSQAKYFIYTRNFVSYLARGSREKKSIADLLLELLETPRATRTGIRTRALSAPAVTEADVRNVLDAITKAYTAGEITEFKYHHHRAFVISVALSGQRPVNMGLLTTDEWSEGLKRGYVTVPADKDKNGVEHIFPVHTCMRDPLERVVAERDGDDLLFNYTAVQRFMREHPVTLVSGKRIVSPKMFRKFFTQYGTAVGFNPLYKNYIQSHEMTGVGIRHYESIKLEDVVKEYKEKICLTFV